jgi:hypothetical protein
MLLQAAHSALNMKDAAIARWARRMTKHRNIRVCVVARRLAQALSHVSLTRAPYAETE